MTKDKTKIGGIKNRQTVHQMESSIEEQWKSIPKQARAFLLETPLQSLTLHNMTKFWSSAQISPLWSSAQISPLWSSPQIAGIIRDASLSIALKYLYLGKVDQARALMLNSSFIIECMDKGAETIFQWCSKNPDVRCHPELKCFSRAYYASEVEEIEIILQGMARLFQNSSQKAMLKFFEAGDGGNNSAKSHGRPPTGSKIQLILVHGQNTEEKQIFDIGTSTTLKTLFNNYADKRGLSLRSLRFSHNGKTLFLSSVGNRTPEDLAMKDKDVIAVQDANYTYQEASNSSAAKKKVRTHKKDAKRHTNNRKKPKGKGRKDSWKQQKTTKTMEEHRTDHSILLSKLHEEAQSQLKAIRMALNAQDLERQPPKKRRKSRGKNKAQCQIEVQPYLPNSGIGGKAGKPYFMVQVGEIQNLYKTSKSLQRGSCIASTLDLHGCTKGEALRKLDESLTSWVDAAMRGSYPFVCPAKIICGCGNQIISETVENWIREHAQVAKSPKEFF